VVPVMFIQRSDCRKVSSLSIGEFIAKHNSYCLPSPNVLAQFTRNVSDNAAN
jgi:hypothetical protein